MDPSADLLRWYDRHARTLPWRVPPGEKRAPDPYHVWLSEVMLQQTTVAAVAPRYLAFLARWPTVKDLAAADEGDVLREWAGLGYYARARNLHACAKRVAVDGFPRTEAELRQLPGIGDYTAASIAAIAFGEAAAVVDGNIERVVTRLLADATPLPAARRPVRAWMAQETPAHRPGDFVQAMMDLGATICTPRAPSCLLCPLAAGCAAHERGEETAYPVKPARKARPTRRGTAFVALRNGKVWLVRRPPSGLLGGTTAVPTDGWSARRDGDGAPPCPGTWTKKGAVEHGFTHFALVLDVLVSHDAAPAGDGWWGEAAGLPTLFRKVVEAAGVAVHARP